MSKQYAHLHAMAKTYLKFQNDWPKKITLSKIDEICPISNPKPDLLNINACTKFG